jgi:hypothetical protein
MYLNKIYVCIKIKLLEERHFFEMIICEVISYLLIILNLSFNIDNIFEP